MRPTKLAAPVLFVLAVAAGGCDRSPAGPADALTADELAALTIADEEIAGGVVYEEMGLFGPAGALAPAETTTRSRDFDRVRDCPAGGTVETQGTITRSDDGAGAQEFDVAASRTRTDCAHARRNGVTVTVSGGSTIEAHRKRVNGEPVGNQTSSASGHFAWTRTDGDVSRSGECDFSIDVVRNPDSRMMTITGTICGRDIDRTVDWKRGT